jgi:hypothetical protein
MKPRFSVLTLDVNDLERSLSQARTVGATMPKEDGEERS